MPINIKFAPDARVIGDAYSALGYGQAAAANSKTRAAMMQRIQDTGSKLYLQDQQQKYADMRSNKLADQAEARWAAREDVKADNRQEYQQQGIEGRGGLQDERLAAAEKNLGRRLTSQA